MFKLNKGNSKLGNSIYTINLSRKSCRPDAPCYKLCYAGKGTFLFPNVKNCYDANYNAYIENPEKFERDLLEQLPLYGFVRIHASGDFIDRSYLDMIVRVCKVAKNVKFMAYTKKYELINSYLDDGKKLPRNLKIIFSIWDTFPCDNRYNLPTASVIFKGQEQPQKGFICDNNCDKCFHCWGIRNGQQVLFKQH
jgi:hypothetical protein